MGKIVWLASYPKSGNTWLRAFLHNFLRNPDEPYDLNRMDEYSLGDSGGIFYQKFLRKPVKEMTDEEIMILRPKVQEMHTRSTPDNVFVKTHNALVEYLDRPMISMEHTAAAIYVVRNPLDVLISHADHYGTTIDESIDIMNSPNAKSDSGIHSVFELQCSWSRHVESWTGRPHRALHVMRYEDLHLRPLETFGGLVRLPRAAARARPAAPRHRAFLLQGLAQAGGGARLPRALHRPGALLPRGQGGGMAREADAGPRWKPWWPSTRPRCAASAIGRSRIGSRRRKPQAPRPDAAIPAPPYTPAPTTDLR